MTGKNKNKKSSEDGGDEFYPSIQVDHVGSGDFVSLTGKKGDYRKVKRFDLVYDNTGKEPVLTHVRILFYETDGKPEDFETGSMVFLANKDGVEK